MVTIKVFECPSCGFAVVKDVPDDLLEAAKKLKKLMTKYSSEYSVGDLLEVVMKSED